VSGAAGIGKTTLVVRWAHGVADRFPDGQLFVNLRGYHPSGEHLSPADALRSFLEAFGIATNRIPADLDSRAALYRSVLNGRRVLVVLDNARDVEQVRPLLPGYPGCVVVVTSRDRMVELVTAEAADTVLVGPLGAGEARDLLARRLGDDRLAAEPEAIADIVSRCAGLPLALAVTAATCAIRPGFALAAAAAWLSDPTAVLAAPSGAPGRADVRAVFSWSYRTLDEPSARMFRLIGLNSGPDLTTPAAASLAGLSEVAARPLLGQLVEAGLLLVDNAGRYACHDLVHAYAADLATRLDPAGERTEAMWRLIDHYLHSAFVAARLFNPQREPISLDQPRPGVTAERRADLEEASAWFDVERPALLAALRTAVRLGSDRHTWQLAWVVQDHLARGGHWDDQVANQLAAIEATRRAGLPLAEAHALCTLASAYARLQRYDEAEADLHRALALHAAANDHAGHANAHYQLGWLSNRRGRHGAALGHARQALRLFRLAGSPLGTARALNSLGWDHALHGDFARAQPRCERALAELRRLGDRHFEAAAADSLGFIHHRLGDYPAAVGHYRHALELFRESGDRYHTADTLNHLGDVHLADADAEAAATAWQAALAIFEELDYSDAEGVRAKLADLEPPAT
jgi:tetratricopeptide (TPR) repeat protein